MGLMTAMLGLGALGTAAGVADARKGRKAAERAQQESLTRAREEAALNRTRDDTGADIELGVEDVAQDEQKRRRRATSASGGGSAVGGLRTDAAMVGGLR